MTFSDKLKTAQKEAVESKKDTKKHSKTNHYKIFDVKTIRKKLNVSYSEITQPVGARVDTIKSEEMKR